MNDFVGNILQNKFYACCYMLLLLQAGLPETTHLCAENKPAKKDLKYGTARTKLKARTQSKLIISQLTWLKTTILGH